MVLRNTDNVVTQQRKTGTTCAHRVLMTEGEQVCRQVADQVKSRGRDTVRATSGAIKLHNNYKEKETGAQSLPTHPLKDHHIKAGCKTGIVCGGL